MATRVMPDLDYAGPHGGLLGLAFAAGWGVATAMWLMVGGAIWRFFLEPRIKGLEATNAAQAKRIEQLELVLLLHGPPAMRQAMQAVTSELRADLRAVEDKIGKEEE